MARARTSPPLENAVVTQPISLLRLPPRIVPQEIHPRTTRPGAWYSTQDHRQFDEREGRGLQVLRSVTRKLPLLRWPNYEKGRMQRGRQDMLERQRWEN